LAEKSQRHSQAVQISGWGDSQLFCISLYDSANGAYGQSGFDPNCNRDFAKNVAHLFFDFFNGIGTNRASRCVRPVSAVPPISSMQKRGNHVSADFREPLEIVGQRMRLLRSPQ
jgi:hypothetical protein